MKTTPSPFAGVRPRNPGPLRGGWLVALLGALLGLWGPARAQSPAALVPALVLRDTTREYSLGRSWAVLTVPADPARRVTLAQVRAPAWAARFRPSQQDVPNFRGSSGDIWLRATLLNQAGPSTVWLLRAMTAASDTLTVYVVGADGHVLELTASPAVSYARSHAEPSRHYNLRLPLPQGQPTMVYVRASAGPLNLSMYEQQFFRNFTYWENFTIAAFLGSLLMLALYNLFLYASIRERSYLYYVGYVLSFSALMLQMKNLLYLWLYPWLAGGNDELLRLLLLGVNMLMGNLMARAFLETPRRAPRLDWLLRAMLLLAPLPLLLRLLSLNAAATLLSIVLPLVSCLVLIVVGTAVLRTGYRPARYYMAGWGVVVLSIASYNLAQLNILPANGWTINNSAIAWVLEMVFLSLGLADRINLSRQAQRDAQAEVLATLSEKEIVQQRANQQLAARATELEQANAQLQASLATTDHLQELDTIKTNFFTNISHEFRTPLTLILGPAEELQDDGPDPASRRRGSLILRNARRLLRLINQLLDLSKLDAGAMRLAPTRGDVAGLTRQLAASFAALAEAQGVRFRTEGPVRLPFVFDGPKLEAVLTNLLSNALRFTPAGGEVTLGWHEAPATPAAPAGLELTVRDTGPGIAAEHQPRLFDRFYQGAHPTTPNAQPGTGVGLTLVRELTELHGGTVAVHSPAGQGATFTVRLPEGLVPGPAPAVPADEPAAVPIGPAASLAADADVEPLHPDADVVLFVEDNEDVREFIRTSLAPAGYRLLEAPDGLQGVALALAEVPDLVISDVMMPGLDGYGVVRQLKQHPATSHVPVVLLTARTAAADRLEGLELGADAYLNKPFAARELRAQVRNLLALRDRTRSYARATLALLPAPGPMAPAGPHAGTSPPTDLVADAAADVEAAEAAVPTPGAGASLPRLSALDRRFLAAVAQAVAANLAESDFDVDQLSSAVALSRTQMQRKLRALTGQAPAEYIRTARLGRALELLRERAGTVAEVGYEVGFSSPAHFSTVFSRHYGYPPSEVSRPGVSQAEEVAG